MLDKCKHWLVTTSCPKLQKTYAISVYCNNPISMGEAIDRANSIIRNNLTTQPLEGFTAIGSDEYDLVTTIHHINIK
jgi:hypothetical protein